MNQEFLRFAANTLLSQERSGFVGSEAFQERHGSWQWWAVRSARIPRASHRYAMLSLTVIQGGWPLFETGAGIEIASRFGYRTVRAGSLWPAGGGPIEFHVPGFWDQIVEERTEFWEGIGFFLSSQMWTAYEAADELDPSQATRYYEGGYGPSRDQGE